MMADEKTFEGWAIVELMGHRRLGGYIREVELAGAAMLRLDVPEHETAVCSCGSIHPESGDFRDHEHNCMLFAAENAPPQDVYATQFYSAAALYCLTPTTEAIARAVRSRPAPVHTWEFPRRELEPVPRVPIGDDLDEEDRPF